MAESVNNQIFSEKPKRTLSPDKLLFSNDHQGINIPANYLLGVISRSRNIANPFNKEENFTKIPLDLRDEIKNRQGKPPSNDFKITELKNGLDPSITIIYQPQFQQIGSTLGILTAFREVIDKKPEIFRVALKDAVEGIKSGTYRKDLSLPVKKIDMGVAAGV